MNPVFSILVPAFNSRLTLELVLRCLEAQTWPRDQFECLIVDDGSRDGTSAFLGRYQPGLNLRYFSHPTNQGRSHARNTAAREANGDIFIFLDADMLPDPDWLAGFAAAFAQAPALEVVSGGRYHLNLGSQPDHRPSILAQALGLPVEELFVARSAQQFERLHAIARPAMYPSQAMEKFEAQLPEVCRQYPKSLLCAYSLITSNVAVRRSAFEKAGGFDPSMRRTEDTDLGVRLWETGAGFGFAADAKAYHLYHTGQGDRNNTLVERMAFFYRHPYLLVVLVNLWFAYHDRPDPSPPSSTFDSLLALLAAEQELPDIDVSQEFYRIYRQSAWADCIFDQDFMAEYYGEHSGIPRAEIDAYLDRAIARGLITHRRDKRFYFDFDHTTNWLRKCTTYQQYELEHTRYSWLRDWIPGPGVERSRPEQGGHKSKKVPLSFRCRSIYEVNIPSAALPGTSVEAMLNIPLPVEHACQTVQIVRCVPANLLDYVDHERTMVSNFPLEQGLNEEGGITLCYEFECQLREHQLTENFEEITSKVNHARYLKPTYPLAQLARAEAILKKIFAGPANDSYTIAHTIYTWILNNTHYLQSTLADYLILETGFGPCFHLARLFVNLCRLMRVPAREQCGALFGRNLAPETPQRTIVTGRGYNILTHTWAEFHSPGHGWIPVEFSAADLGRHILTATNVSDESLRDRLIRETDLYSAYYFGNLDPFRIYAGEHANRAPTYPLVKSRLAQEALKKLIFQTRHRLVCDFSGAAEFSDLRASLSTVAEVSRSGSTAHLRASESKGRAQGLAKTRVPRRVIVTSLGSTGDMQPLLALAEELRHGGDEIVFAVPAIFKDRIQSFGFRFAEIGAGTDLASWHTVFARQATIADPIEQMRYFVEALVPRLPQIFGELRDLCSEADVLISPPFQLAARMVHDATGLPFVSVHFSPFGFKSGKAMRDASAPLVNRCRQQAGLPPLEDPLGADGASPQLALYAVSRHVFRPPADWPPRYHLTGYFFLDEEIWQPDPKLAEFVQTGDPPVAVTFGSMPSDDPKALTDLILRAIEQAGCRAIIQRGGSDLTRGCSLPENVYAVDFVPHRWLFPHASCVVHHGGAGTTAATFRAGVPAVIVPHLLDQPIWAEFAGALGCAGAAIPRAQLTAEQLGAAIARTQSNLRYHRAAARLGEQVRAENGVRTARQLIEQKLFASDSQAAR